MSELDKTEVGRNDLLAAWMVLENLTVSLDQIGGTFAEESDTANGAANTRAFQEALSSYLNPELVKAISDARNRLSHYLSEEEAESLPAQISYWDYGAARKPAGNVR